MKKEQVGNIQLIQDIMPRQKADRFNKPVSRRRSSGHAIQIIFMDST